MKTCIATLSEIDRAADLLKMGMPVVFPTETVYGLGAPVFLPEAVLKIFLIKDRPIDNPLIVHISAIEDVPQLCEAPPPAFFQLARRFWPGPLAMILKRKETVPPIVSAGHPTIAIRMPDCEGALRLIKRVGQPLVAPSANLSGRPSPTRALDALEDLDGKVELILDGGPCRIGIESTVLSLVHPKPVLLRPGAITKEDIEAVLGEAVALPSPGEPILAPGMKYRHYAPKARVRLLFNRSEVKGSFVLSSDPQPGERLLSAHTLYAALREADRLGVAEIEIDCAPSVQADAALFNRLLRASSR